MLNRSTQPDTLQNKDKVRTINLGAYFSIIAVSGLIVSTTSVLGILSAVLVSTFALALFYSIDDQLLNDALMLKFKHYSQALINDTEENVVCEIMDQQLNDVNIKIEDVYQLSAKQPVETLGHVA